MGHSLSPILCQFDLEFAWYDLVQGKLDRPPHVWWPKKPLETVIASVLHVDDCLLASRDFCSACVIQIVGRVWPCDVQLKDEGSNFTESTSEPCPIEFLHLEICPGRDARSFKESVECHPIVHNLAFIRGLDDFPQSSRLGLFHCADITTREQLRSYMWSKFCGFCSVYAHREVHD